MVQEQKTESVSVSPKRAGINYWRNVRYLDDGVTCYQCLLCKQSWHAAEAPGYTWSGHDPDHPAGEYTPSWKFCPFCATQWIGEKIDVKGRELERKIDDHTWKFRKEYPQNKRWTIQYSSFSTKWEWRDSICLQPYCTYKDAYRRLQLIRGEEDERSKDIENHFLEYDERLKERYRAILK
jgi:hypothetical protein